MYAEPAGQLNLNKENFRLLRTKHTAYEEGKDSRRAPVQILEINQKKRMDGEFIEDLQYKLSDI